MKSDCATIRSWLGAYVDGELASFDRRDVARHLHDCPACRREAVEIEQLERALRRSLAREAPGAGFTENLPRQIEEQFDLAAARARWRPPVAPPWWRRLFRA